MEKKIEKIKEWLGAGSINIFGLPMSGKDTVGIKLAEVLGARFLSSGMIIRAMEQTTRKKLTNKGLLAPTDVFFEWVLPYFEREDLKNDALILSSVGRWHGEEEAVINAARNSGHQIKAAVILNVSETEVGNRWQVAKTLNDRGARPDDVKPEVFETRIKEFREKTLPVLQYYQNLGILVPVKANMGRTEVFEELIDRLYDFTMKNQGR